MKRIITFLREPEDSPRRKAFITTTPRGYCVHKVKLPFTGKSNVYLSTAQVKKMLKYGEVVIEELKKG